MSNTKKFAERELEILVKSATDPDNRPIIEEFIPEILALVDKFGHSGQSGGSAPYTASAISKAIMNLCLQKPICPITGIDEEWGDVTEMSDGDIMFQNGRCAALFKDGRKKRAYYLDAIVFREANSNNCFTGSALLMSGEKVSSRQFIRAFPFEPKTFYIDVVDKSVGKDGTFDHYIKDEKQLHEVFSYYKSPWSRNVLIEKVV